MKALLLTQTAIGQQPLISLVHRDIPQVSEGEVLVKVHASAIHPSDLINSRGGFPYTTFPRIPGRDFAGTIVSGPRDGEEVYGTSGSTYAFTADGFQAEYCVVQEDAVASKPRNISFADAACIGVPFTTAALTLKKASVLSSDTLLVIGANGAVGSAVVQLARCKGCVVFTGARDATADICTTTDPDLSSIDTFTQGRGVDVVIDTVGIPALTEAAVKRLTHGGRLVFIALHGASSLEIEMRDFYRQEKSLIGCNSLSYSAQEMAKEMSIMTTMFESGKLKIPANDVWTVVSLGNAVEVYQHAEQKQSSKYVISME